MTPNLRLDKTLLALAHLARRAMLQRLCHGAGRTVRDVAKRRFEAHSCAGARLSGATQTRGSRESAYFPELVERDVVFSDYEMVAGKRDSFGKSGCGEVLKKFYDAVAKRDLAAARTYLADDLAFVGLARPIAAQTST